MQELIPGKTMVTVTEMTIENAVGKTSILIGMKGIVETARVGIPAEKSRDLISAETPTGEIVSVLLVDHDTLLARLAEQDAVQALLVARGVALAQDVIPALLVDRDVAQVLLADRDVAPALLEDRDALQALLVDQEELLALLAG